MKIKPGYRIYKFTDETGYADPKGYWSLGEQCYLREYKCLIPISLKEENIDQWLYDHEDEIDWIE